ncbi:MAG: trehalase family glycosidase [Ignavibacteriaceae bacterium]
MKSILFLLFILLNFLSAAQADSVKVTFHYSNLSVENVSVAGSFNGWNPDGYNFTKSDTAFTLSINLPAGYYYYKLVVDGKWIYDPGNPLKVNDGGSGFNSILKAGDPPVPKRKISERTFPKEKLPRPVLEKDNEIIELYYAAWYMAWNKIMKGNRASGFVEEFMDEGFNEMIYQWDTCFMVAFGMYAPDIFPAMPSLDNFYNKQREDGYIQRVYNENTGEPAAEPVTDEPMVNPPLFAWIEYRYYVLSGDNSRLKRVLPHLIKYFKWIENNCRTKEGNGLYYTTHLGSGMDNTPRPGVNKAGWLDFSLQQGLAAKYISSIASAVHESVIEEEFNNYYQNITELINKYCWDNSSGFYYDMKEDGSRSPVVHIGAYWALLSETADSAQAESLVNYLNDKKHFKRPHMVPALSFSDPAYDSLGHYWLGSVWAPTNYMVVKGLEKYGYNKLANDIAYQHVKKIARIYKHFNPDEEKIAYEERYNDAYNTIWECYSPEFNEPATRWDNTFYSRQDFVGWSGLGPTAMLIENIIGLKLNGLENIITWHINRSDKHGIENLRFREQLVSLIYNPEEKRIMVSAEKDLVLKTIYNENIQIFSVKPGDNIFLID